MTARNARGHLLLAVVFFFAILAAAVGTRLAVVALLSVGPVVTLAGVAGVAMGALAPDSIGGLLLAVVFSLLTVLAVASTLLAPEAGVWNLAVLFGLVVDFLAGLAAVLSVAVPEDTQRPTPGPPHGF